MYNACFRFTASSLLKRNIFRMYREKFGYSALLRILRERVSIKSKGPCWRQKIEKKVTQCRKKVKAGPFSALLFCMLRLKSKK